MAMTAFMRRAHKHLRVDEQYPLPPREILDRTIRARLQRDAGEFYHWAKVAAEVGRIAPQAAMDIDAVRAIVAEEERRGT